MTPKGLGAAGRSLWRELTAAYDLEPGEAVLLEHACRTADELARLTAELGAAELTVEGSTGQPRAHPLVDEVRRHRAALAALMKQLTPEPASTRKHPSTSEWGQEAARARWAKHRPRVVS